MNSLLERLLELLPISRADAGPQDVSPAELYLDLLKKCLTRSIFGEGYEPVEPTEEFFGSVATAVQESLAAHELELIRRTPFDPEVRSQGLDWPAEAETMIGMKRLDNIQYCATEALRRGIPGDLIETGVWRGGATILMRAVLKAYGDRDRVVWAAFVRRPAQTRSRAFSGRPG